MAATVALSGCRNQAFVEATARDSGAPASEVAAAPQVGQIRHGCWGSGPAVMLVLGVAACNSTEPADVTFGFIIGGHSWGDIQPGATFEIAGDIHGSTTGVRGTKGQPNVPLTGGTIKFTTYDFGKSATGSYDVVFPGGAAANTFSAGFCPSPGCVARPAGPPPAPPTPPVPSREN